MQMKWLIAIFYDISVSLEVACDYCIEPQAKRSKI